MSYKPHTVQADELIQRFGYEDPTDPIESSPDPEEIRRVTEESTINVSFEEIKTNIDRDRHNNSSQNQNNSNSSQESTNSSQTHSSSQTDSSSQSNSPILTNSNIKTESDDDDEVTIGPTDGMIYVHKFIRYIFIYYSRFCCIEDTNKKSDDKKNKNQNNTN